MIRTINQKGGIEISNGVDWAFARSIHPSFELWFASAVFGMFRNSIWNYSRWLDLNSLSLFTDHPLLRVSLITSRLLPMGRPRPKDENEEKKEEVDVDEDGYEGPPCLRWPTWYINLWSPSRESEFMGEGITRCGRADALHPNLYRASFFKPTTCVPCVPFPTGLPCVQGVLCVLFMLELAPQLVLSKLL